MLQTRVEAKQLYFGSSIALEENINTLRHNSQTSTWAGEVDAYVPLRGSWQAYAKDDFDLDEKFNTFLHSDKKVLLLLGDAGSGKSLYTQRLVAQQWQSYQSQGVIPLWISLPSLNDPLHHIMQEALENAGFTPEAIEEARITRQFLLILDGYDEIRQWQNLYVTNKLKQWQVKVIITCRREYLYHQDNYRFHFVPFNKERAQWMALSEMVVKPFSPEQIDTYLQQVVAQGDTQWQDWQQYRAAIDEIPGLSQLLATPFMLKMAMDVLPKLIEQHRQSEPEKRLQITQASLYDAFMQHWFERQEVKLKEAHQIPDEEDIKSAFWNYAKALAQAMHQAKLTTVHYEPDNDLFNAKETPGAWSRFFTPEDPKIALLQTACLVREVSPHHYAFIHSSLLDYFLTRQLYETVLLEGLNTNFPKDDKEKSVKEENHSSAEDYFKQHLFVQESNMIQFMADRIQGEGGEKFIALLFDYIEASKHDAGMSKAAANGITVLNRAKISLSGKDFRGICIPNADLSHALLSSTDLTFADLSGVRLHQAYLAHADMSNACLRDVSFGQCHILNLEDCVNTLSYSTDSKWIVTGDDEGKLTLWDAVSGQKQEQATGGGNINSVAFSPDGLRLAVGSNYEDIDLWDMKNGKPYPHLTGHTKGVLAVVFSPGGRHLASGSDDKTVRLWDIEKGELLQTFSGHTSYVTTVAFSPDGCLLASGSGDKTVRLWDTQSGEALQTLSGHTEEVSTVAFNSDGWYLGSGSADKTIRLWDTRSWQVQQILKGTSPVATIAFSPGGCLLASGSLDNIVRFWDIQRGEVLQAFMGHTSLVTTVAFNFDGSRLASGSRDSTVRLWNMKDVEEQQIFRAYIEEFTVCQSACKTDPLSASKIDPPPRHQKQPNLS